MKTETQERDINALFIFNTLLFEASKWFRVLEQQGMKHEVKYIFKDALDKMQRYERLLEKVWGAYDLGVQDDIGEGFSNLLLELSKMDAETKDRFAEHISQFLEAERAKKEAAKQSNYLLILNP
jgi:hypothetical protein